MAWFHVERIVVFYTISDSIVFIMETAMLSHRQLDNDSNIKLSLPEWFDEDSVQDVKNGLSGKGSRLLDRYDI